MPIAVLLPRQQNWVGVPAETWPLSKTPPPVPETNDSISCRTNGGATLLSHTQPPSMIEVAETGTGGGVWHNGQGGLS